MENKSQLSNISEQNEQKSFWLSRFEKAEYELEYIPYDKNKKECKRAVYEKGIKDEVAKDFYQQFGNKTLLKYVVLLSSVKVMFYLLYQKNNIPIWGPAYKAESQEENPVVFVDTLEKNDALKLVLNKVKDSVGSAYQNQKVNVTSLFQSFMEEGGEEFSHVWVGYNQIAPKKETIFSKEGSILEFDFTESDGTLMVSIAFDESRYLKETMESIAETMETLLEKMIHDRECSIDSIETVSIQKMNQFIYGKRTEVLADQTIVSAFEEVVEKYPDHTALVCGDEELSYKQLDEKVNQVAQYLVAQPEYDACDFVGIFMDKRFNIVIAALGILKANKAYIPINLEYPLEKQKEVLDDSEIRIVLTEKEWIGQINRLQWDCEYFSRYLCMDSQQVYEEEEQIDNDLMNKEVWEYVGEQAENQIEGGAWVSSFTNESISVEEMDEYSDNVLKKLMPYLTKETRVLEIGCASGLTMYKIAPYVGFYYGTDLSENTIKSDIAYNEKHGVTNVKLKAMPAHEVSQLEEADFDIIIMNSVIQCFQGHNYLRKVIKNAMSKMKDNGIFFFGDIMDLDRKDALIKALLDFKEKNQNQNYRTKTNWDSELFLSKRYFEDLQFELDGIEKVDVTDKIFTIENELTLFRYDVIMTVNKELPRKGFVSKDELEKDKQQEDRLQKHKFQDGTLAMVNCSTNKPTQCKVVPDSKAYVIYTSGTTGKPKGVIVDHKNLINMVKNTEIPYDFGCNDVWTLFHSFCFDFSVWEMYGALLTGGKLVLIPKAIQRDTQAYYNCLVDYQVTVLNQTPGAFYNLMDIEQDAKEKLNHLRYVIFGGEALNFQKIKPALLNYPSVQFVNMYGITETTIHVTFKAVTLTSCEEEVSNIGRPLPDYSCYVMSAFGKQQPYNVCGELVVGGRGVAEGYLHREELTKQKFIQNPYNEEEYLYRSGDLVKMQSNGELVYLGRIDQQIKIRGHRIEKGEVEQAVLSLPSIENVYIADYKNKENETVLCCYYCADHPMTVKEFHEELDSKIPDYCIPSYFVHMKSIPLNRNGKVNRAKLLNPLEHIYSGSVHEKPTNPVEQDIADIWTELLGVENIGILDNFFELGGHSLKATMFSSRILKKYNVKIPLNQIFATPTIKELAEFVIGHCQTKESFVSIPKAEKKPYYKATASQSRFYMIQTLAPDCLAYNVPYALESDDEISETLVEHALTKLMERHQQLTAYFDKENGEIVQKFQENVTADFTLFQAKSETERTGYVTEFVKPFDLSKAPLIRMGLVKTPDCKDVLLFDMHHIISDGFSMNIIIKEFFELYGGAELEQGSLSYVDYSEWMNKRKLEEQKNYWHKQFEEEVLPLDIRTDHKRPAEKSYDGNCVEKILEKEFVEQVKEFCQDNGVTEYMFFLSAMGMLLAKYTGQEDLVIGSPVSGRRYPGLEDIVGVFINTLALRLKPNGEETYLEYLDKVKTQCLGAFENQEYPFEQLVNDLGRSSDLSRNPLFDVMFILQNQSQYHKESVNGFRPLDNGQRVSKFDLAFIFEKEEDTLAFSIEYCKDLFEEETVSLMMNRYLTLVKEIICSKEAKIKDISYLDEQEMELIWNRFNDTKEEVDFSKDIIDVFEEQVLKSRDEKAICFGDEFLTYGEFKDRVDRLATAILKQTGGESKTVALIAKRSKDLVVGIYAILKAGCVYVPIDFHYPDKSMKGLLEDSEAGLVLTDDVMEERQDVLNGYKVMDLRDEKNYELLETIPANVRKKNKVAYILFTSGTTGKPKGVVVTHHNLMNAMSHMQAQYPVGKKDTYLFKTTYTFDVSMTEIFGWFYNGGRLAVLAQDGEKDPAMILDAIERYEVTHINFVYSMMKVFLHYVQNQNNTLQSVKYFMIAGEKFGVDGVELCRQVNPNMAVVNLYGPTEATVYATEYTVDLTKTDYDTISIGRPWQNTQILILDKYQKLCGPMVPGELCILGDSVSNGYKNNEELTKEKFVETEYFDGGKMYRSGDIAYYKMDGMIECMGRMDEQVKVRGFRIELGEITNAMQSLAYIKDAVALIRKRNDINEIHAYYTATETISPKDVKEALRDELPEYKIPQYIMQLDEIPMTGNQKLNKQALPEIQREHMGDILLPRDEVEEKTARIFEKILSLDTISVTDSFFELGGHSLNFLSAIDALNQEFNTRIRLTDIFHHPTVAFIAQWIKEHDSDGEGVCVPVITKAEERPWYPVTDEQLDMFLAYEIYPDNVSYNMPLVFHVEGPFEVETFKEAVVKIVKANDILRTRFERIDNEIVQKVYNDEEFEVVVEDISRKDISTKNSTEDSKENSVENDEFMKEKLTQMKETFVRPFRLEKDTLLRVKIVKVSNEKYTILMDMHHIIIDGISLGILIRDMINAYLGSDVVKKEIQFKDFAILRKQQKEEKKEDTKAFWKERINTTIKPIELETKIKRPDVISLEGANEFLFLEEELSKKLNQMAAEKQATLFQVMFTAYYVLLRKYSKQDDLVIGAVTSGRSMPQTYDMLGMFVKTLPIRLQAKGELTFEDLLNRVKEEVLEVFEHDNCSFQEILTQSGITVEPGRHPLFDVAMVVQNEDLSFPEVDSLTFEGEPTADNVSKYDLLVEVMEEEKNIRLKFEYCTKLFETSYIHSMVDDMKRLLVKITENPLVTIDTLLEQEYDLDNFTPMDDDVMFDF